MKQCRINISVTKVVTEFVSSIGGHDGRSE